jgi:hypothetical protein
MFWSTRSGLLKLCHPNFLFLIIKFVPLALPVTLEMTFPTPKMDFYFPAQPEIIYLMMGLRRPLQCLWKKPSRVAETVGQAG